ncbi:hypothetical protein AAVH_22827 [Aphelenchoides avenae]|nr:hypothetical protein AAVH_22827 [Aphelenchus avenae]
MKTTALVVACALIAFVVSARGAEVGFESGQLAEFDDGPARRYYASEPRAGRHRRGCHCNSRRQFVCPCDRGRWCVYGSC